MQDEKPVKAANSKVGWSYHGSIVLGLVGKRRKEMCWQKLTKEFFNSCFKQRNVMFRMVFNGLQSKVSW